MGERHSSCIWNQSVQGLHFGAIDLNAGKILKQEKNNHIFSRLSLYNHWVTLVRTRVANFIKYIVHLIK